MTAQAVVEIVFIVIGGLLGLAVSFVGLATLCDAWLTPWLQVAQKKMLMSDDLAGVTLMAFGGAAPEIMISIIAVLSGNMKIGFGLLCGSAIIAFGFIPPYCYFSVGSPLDLRAFPIIRDTAFYLVALGAVTAFIFTNDGHIDVYESSGLLVYWVIYVVVVVFVSPEALPARRPLTVRKAVMRVPVKVAKAAKTFLKRGQSRAERLPLVSTPPAALEPEEPGIFGRMYLSLDSGFDFVFSYTVPPPPLAKNLVPESADTSAAMTALGVFAAFIWLATLSEAVYELVLIICDSTTFLSPTALGSILLAVGSQAPDALGAAAMARAGIEEGAISSALASQVVALTIGFGLPWTIYLAMGNEVNLATTAASQVADGALLGIVVLVALFFMGTTLLTPSEQGGVRIDRNGAVVTLCAFAVAFTGLITLEALFQSGDL